MICWQLALNCLSLSFLSTTLLLVVLTLGGLRFLYNPSHSGDLHVNNWMICTSNQICFTKWTKFCLFACNICVAERFHTTAERFPFWRQKQAPYPLFESPWCWYCLSLDLYIGGNKGHAIILTLVLFLSGGSFSLMLFLERRGLGASCLNTYLNCAITSFLAAFSIHV
jgi:hypothetical protein